MHRMNTYQLFAVQQRLEPSIKEAFRNTKILDYPTWDSKLYGGMVPSEETLVSVFKTEAEKLERHLICRMMQLTGRILKCDHTFKMAKIIKVNGVKPYEALFCIMNENNEIIGFWLAPTTKISELESALLKVRERYKHLPEDEQIQVMYTDNCCKDRATLQAIFGAILVKLDIFHLINRLKVKKKHRFFKSFMGKIREAMFCDSDLDMKEFNEAFKSRGNDDKVSPSNRFLTNNKIRRRKVVGVYKYLKKSRRYLFVVA